jgi:uncharacterized protein (TIGR00299 family) protein
LHIHLDPLGGVAGDMFVAAVLDAWPELADALPAILTRAGLPASVTVASEERRDASGVFNGRRFVVRKDGREADGGTDRPGGGHGGDHHHDHGHDRGQGHDHDRDHGLRRGHDHAHDHDPPHAHEHAHTRFRDIRARLEASDLPRGVIARAVDIFAHLAVAEGRVHGRPADEVAFHEVGAWDSIADIVGAAWLVEEIGADGWSVGPLPLGSGTVATAHGTLPVPAPATAILLEGMIVHDDGCPGERVTPTGAAILRHLAPASHMPATPHRIRRTGIGVGGRSIPGVSNILRLLALEPAAADADRPPPEIAVLRFEVDDQAPEDLAVGLENLRAHPAVLDVLQVPAFGKKGRLTAQVQVLARPEAVDEVLRLSLRETSTLGVRWHLERRHCLERDVAERDGVRVKLVRRPDGAVTGKAEMDDVAHREDGYAGRRRARHAAEDAAENAGPDREGDHD